MDGFKMVVIKSLVAILRRGRVTLTLPWLFNSLDNCLSRTDRPCSTNFLKGVGQTFLSDHIT